MQLDEGSNTRSTEPARLATPIRSRGAKRQEERSEDLLGNPVEHWPNESGADTRNDTNEPSSVMLARQNSPSRRTRLEQSTMVHYRPCCFSSLRVSFSRANMLHFEGPRNPVPLTVPELQVRGTHTLARQVIKRVVRGSFQIVSPALSASQACHSVIQAQGVVDGRWPTVKETNDNAALHGHLSARLSLEMAL